MLKLKEPNLWRSRCLVAGSWVDSRTKSVISVVNPSTGETFAHVPKLDMEDVADAIAAADLAFVSWSRQTASSRGQILNRWCQLMLTHIEDLAALMTAEQGKPLAESRAEIRYAASYLDWFAQEAERVYGDVIPAQSVNQKIIIQKQPVGVCAVITPWNFPVAMLARKVAAAIACGCTVVAKPSSATPLSALAFAFLGQEAGLPSGVFNVVTGNAVEIAEVFTSSALVKKISFTGSTVVGQKLVQQSAKHLQKVSLELGGNAPCLVFDDADLERAAAGIVAAKFRNAGQTCICINRLYVQRPVYQELIERLEVAVAALTVGDGMCDGVEIGPLINGDAVKKFDEHLQDAMDHGAELICGGVKIGGNFVRPTLLKNASHHMLFCREESFSPLLAVIPFTDEEEAIRLANDTHCGLAAYFYSGNLQRVMRVMDSLEAGMVGVNETALSNAAAPFGGIKSSGYGREGSKYGFDDYLTVKYILIG